MTQLFTAFIEVKEDTYIVLGPKIDIASQGKIESEARNKLREASSCFRNQPRWTKSRAAFMTRTISPEWRSPLGQLKVLFDEFVDTIFETDETVPGALCVIANHWQES